MTLGQKIYELRTARNLSQGDLSNLLDVSRQSVSKWETDSATPDLDKLMKLCDIFEVTLDELVGREKESAKRPETISPPIRQSSTQPTPASAFTTPKIVGYILLTVSLLGWILLAVFADPLLAVMIAMPMLICAIICLTVKHKVGYWCMLVVWILFELFTKYFMVGEIGISTTTVCMSVFRVALHVILFLITLRAFKDAPLTHKRKGILLIAWIIYLILPLILHALPLILANLILANLITELSTLAMITVDILSAIPIIATPFLFIYTARYLSSKGHTASNE